MVMVHSNVSLVFQIRGDMCITCPSTGRGSNPLLRYGLEFLTVLNIKISRAYTYGTTCELKAAGEIFPYDLQVFWMVSFLLPLGTHYRESKESFHRIFPRQPSVVITLKNNHAGKNLQMRLGGKKYAKKTKQPRHKQIICKKEWSMSSQTP